MKKSLLTLVFTGLFFAAAIAQFKAADWSPKPAFYLANDEFKKEGAIVMLDKRTHLFSHDAKGEYKMLVTTHKVVMLNDDKGIEAYNKVYIPVPQNGKILSLKARVLTPSKKVIDMPKDKIFEVEEEGRLYKKFAFEGLEHGSQIEYYYEQQKDGGYFGLEVFAAGNYPCQNASLTVVTPAFLYYNVKGYNGFKTLVDTTIEKERIVQVDATDLFPITEEKYSSEDANLRNVQYKLTYNLSKDKNNKLFTWNDFSKNVYNAYTATNSKEEKAVKNFLESAGLSADMPDEKKIVILEDYIKKEINVKEDSDDADLEKLEKVVKTKITTKESLLRLFVQCFNQLGVKYQMVYASNRNDLPLDKNFENFRLTKDMLFYFPTLKGFIEPQSFVMRYPLIEPYNTATDGLFIKPTTIGDLTTAVGTFQEIPMPQMSQHHHNIEVAAALAPNGDSVEIDMKVSLLGYGGAVYYRPTFSFLDKDKMKDFEKEMVEGTVRNCTVKSVKFENTSTLDNSTKVPLYMIAKATNSEILENAGKKLLLKIGTLIGPQEQMYQEKKRQLPIVISYPHTLDRVVKFTVPDGYQIKNLSEINTDVQLKRNGKSELGFIVTHTLNGNLLEIKIHEYYETVSLPLTLIDDYVKVINASADFNKLVLVLEKK